MRGQFPDHGDIGLLASEIKIVFDIITSFVTIEGFLLSFIRNIRIQGFSTFYQRGSEAFMRESEPVWVQGGVSIGGTGRRLLIHVFDPIMPMLIR